MYNIKVWYMLCDRLLNCKKNIYFSMVWYILKLKLDKWGVICVLMSRNGVKIEKD